MLRKSSDLWWPWFICALAAAFYCYEYFLRILPSVMVTDLMQFYQVSAASLGHLVAFYYHAYTPMQLPVGVLMDRYTPRFMLSLACLACVAGSYLFTMTDAFWVAAVGRFWVGFGSAFAFVGVLKLATVWFPPERFALISGLTTTLGMLGGMLGTVLLSDMVKELGWQITNGLFIVVGVILAVMLVLFVSQPPATDGPEDESPAFRWLDFIGVLKNSQIWLGGAVGGFLYASLAVFAEMWGVTFLEFGCGYANDVAARAVSMVFLGWAIGAPTFGWFSDRIQKRKPPLLWGLFFSGVCITCVIYISNLPIYVLFLLLFGYGFFSSSEVIVFAIGRENCPSSLAATAIAVTNMVLMLSGVLLQPLVGTLLDWIWSGQMQLNLPSYALSEFRTALSVLPLGTVLAMCLLLRVRETDAKPPV